jgi:hypothetical protein
MHRGRFSGLTDLTGRTGRTSLTGLTRVTALAVLALLLTSARAALAQPQDIEEPPIPDEPPPPPPPSPLAAPRNALWLGARAGYELPIGAAFTDLRDDRVQERDLLGPGPSLELDVSARLARRFIPFLFYARSFASLGAADRPPPSGLRTATILPDQAPASKVTSSSSTLLGIGLRYSFATGAFGLVAEIAYGYRLTRAQFDDGTLLRAGAPGEFRIGLGAEVRLTRAFALSPMLRFATGSYSDVTVEGADGKEKNALGGSEAHGFVGLEVGGHFDLFGRHD